MIDIYKKIEENDGVYWLNMANPEEAEFALQRMGGRELLKEKFPLIYQAYCKTVEFSQQSGGINLTDKVSITPYASYSKSGTGTKFEGSISGFVCDPAIKRENLGLTAPRPWQIINVELTIKDKDNHSRPPYSSVRRCYRDINSFCRKISMQSKVPESIINRANLFLLMEIQGVDPDGNIHTAFISRNHVNHKKNDGINIIRKITLDDPKYKNKHENNPIIMLYGRKASQNMDYKNADYVDGEYLDNNGGYEGDKSLKTLMPIKGRIVFNTGYEFKGLSEPKANIPMYRPVISLNDSHIVKYFQDKWKGDNPDWEMYNTIKNCFKVDKSAANVCNFDLKINGSVDWKADLKNAGKQIKGNNRVLDYKVSAAFRLNVWDGEMMHYVILMVQYTSNPTIELYASYNGDNTVYIPAVRVYWGCMAKDSSIRTPEGEKPVSEIESGDKILTVNGECVTVAQILSAKEEKIYRIKTDKGSIGLTGGHPILLKDGDEKNASDLQKGDFLLMWEQETAEVLEVCPEDYGDDVYNLLIQESEDGTFLFANGFAVGDTAAQNRPLKAALTEYTDEELKLQEEFGLLWEYREENKL